MNLNKNKKTELIKILRSKKTIFSFPEILLNSNTKKPKTLMQQLNYYTKTNELYSPRKGFYSQDKKYSKLELANKIFTPAYISLEIVLARAGIIFQYYSQIFIISYLSREIKIDNQIYIYKKIKDTILTNSTGIKKEKNYMIASSERAFLDIMYLNKNYHFDNLSTLNWKKVFEILKIYKNKRMEKQVEKYYKKYAS